MNIILKLPPPINQTYKTTRTGGFYKSTEAKEWEELSGWEIKKHHRSIHGLTGPLYVGLLYFFSHDRDIDSSLKITLDLLQKTGVIKNDMDIVHLNVKKLKDIKDPRVEIDVQTL